MPKVRNASREVGGLQPHDVYAAQRPFLLSLFNVSKFDISVRSLRPAGIILLSTIMGGPEWRGCRKMIPENGKRSTPTVFDGCSGGNFRGILSFGQQ